MTERLNSSIDKSLDVLEIISKNSKGLSLAELVKMIGMPKTTVFRILDVLKAREYVVLDQNTEKYSIGIKSLEIGISGLIGQDIVEVSIPYLHNISEKIGETSFLAVYNSGDVVYLYKAEGTRSIQTTARLGSRCPAYCTALGKAILAHLPIEEVDRIFEKKLSKFTSKTVTERVELYEEFANIRANGYASDDEGMERGQFCLGAPIHNYTGSVIAAISVSGPSKRMQENHEQIITELIVVRESISKRLGYVSAMKYKK